MNIINEISRPLSGMDIMKQLKFKPNIIKYSDIHTYKNLDDLLGDDKACVILYLTRSDFGHWCCIYENDIGHIIFFDSYGYLPDDQLNFVESKVLRKRFKQDHRTLTKFLYNSKKPVEYNEYKLQESKEGVATCGRWVITRLKYKNISVDKFAELFLSVKDIIKPDIIITILTN